MSLNSMREVIFILMVLSSSSMFLNVSNSTFRLSIEDGRELHYPGGVIYILIYLWIHKFFEGNFRQASTTQCNQVWHSPSQKIELWLGVLAVGMSTITSWQIVHMKEGFCPSGMDDFGARKGCKGS